MNKITIFLFCSLLTSGLWSQKQLYISPGTNVTLGPSVGVYAGDDVTIEGTLTATSNATKSASFIAASGTVAGDITYKRYVSATGASWNHVAPPVGAETQDVQTFVEHADNAIRTNPGTGNYAVGTWESENNDGEKWAYHNPSPTPGVVTQHTISNFVNGQGYTTSRSTAGIYTFTGAMATADVTKVIGGAGANWTAIGNPYPSFIDASAIYNANSTHLSAVASAMYLWNPTLARWDVFNASSTDQQLHPGQAFLVKAKAGATATKDFVFTETLQKFQNATTNAILRTTPVQKVVVQLTNGTDAATTTIKYFSNTTAGFDLGWDAASFNVQTAAFSIDTHLVADSEGINYTLQCLNDSAYETDVILLSVKAGANQDISFSAVASNLPADMEVYLEDKINNTIQKISDASYTITISEAIDGIGNFYLHASRTVLSNEEVATISSSLNLYKTSNRSLRITGFETQGTASLKIYNTIGQQVFAQEFSMQSINDVALPSLQTGVYIVQVASENGRHTKKIIIE